MRKIGSDDISMSPAVKTGLLVLFICGILLNFIFMLAGKGDKGLTGYLKGADYIHFYNGGRIIYDGNSEKLYDADYFKSQLTDNYNTVGMQKNYPPLYPPTMYYFYVPFSMLPLIWSIFVSTTIYFGMYIFSVFLLLRIFRRLWPYRYFLFAGSVLFPPLLSTFLTGQPSVLYFFILVLTFYFSRRNMPFIAGMVLSFLLVKVNIYAMLFGILLLSFRPKLFLGFLSGSILIVLLTGVFDNFMLWKGWYKIALTYREYMEQDSVMLYRQHTTKSFFHFFYSKGMIGTIFAYIGVGLGALTLVAPVFYSFFHKRNYMRNSFWLITVVALVLANPHLTDYDLVILLLPLFIFINYLFSEKVRPVNILIVITVLNIGLVATSMASYYTHVQVSVLVLWFFLISALLGKRVKNYFPGIIAKS